MGLASGRTAGWLRRVLPRVSLRRPRQPSSTAEASSYPRLQCEARGDSQQKLRPARVPGGWVGRGPSCFRVRASGRRASPSLSERLRPAWAGTSPAAPRPASTRRTAASAADSPGPAWTLRSHHPPPSGCRSAPAREPSTPRTRLRPSRLPSCGPAGARALSSHAPYRLAELACLHRTPPQSPMCACAGTPPSVDLRSPRPKVFFPLHSRTGTLP